MKQLLLFVCLAICMTTYSQAPSKKTLVCDETQVVKSGDDRFRIITTNDSISKRLLMQYKNTLMISYSGYKRIDSRRGDIYWETSYYFNDRDYNIVMAYIKKELQ